MSLKYVSDSVQNRPDLVNNKTTRTHPIHSGRGRLTAAHVERYHSDANAFGCLLVHIGQLQPRMVLLLPSLQRFVCLKWRLTIGDRLQKLIEELMMQRLLFAGRIGQDIFMGNVVEARYSVQTAIRFLIAEKGYRFGLGALQRNVWVSGVTRCVLNCRRICCKHLQYTGNLLNRLKPDRKYSSFPSRLKVLW